MSRSLRRDDRPRAFETVDATGTTPTQPEAKDRSLMMRYMQEARRFPLLSRERELSLARQIREGRSQWQGLLLHHLVHVPQVLACETHLRRGETPISEIWSADGAPSDAELVVVLDQLQSLCDQMRQLVQRPSIHRAEAAPTVAALHADMRALVQAWSWQPTFLHQAWTVFDRDMAAAFASNRFQSISGFTLMLGYRPNHLLSLWRQLQTLDVQVETAKQEMITQNLRLVIYLAYEFHYDNVTNVPLIDLIQEGNIGLMRAVEKFDDRRNLRFSTYAFWWIKQAMRRAMINQSLLIRVPEYLRDCVPKVHRAQDRLTATLGSAPTAQDIAEDLGMPCEWVERSMALTHDPVSLDQPRHEDNTASLHNVLSDTKAVSSQKWIEQYDLSKRLQCALKRLTPRQTEIIRRRFGLDGQPVQTLRQIGLALRLSHERVRQLEARALEKLAQEGEALRDYVSA